MATGLEERFPIVSFGNGSWTHLDEFPTSVWPDLTAQWLTQAQIDDTYEMERYVVIDFDRHERRAW